MNACRIPPTSDWRLNCIVLKRGQRESVPEGAVQAWIFKQFLVLLVFSPIAGAMSVAAYTVIGEKQARTLEPLLATPITTFELLGAKVLGALIPAAALTLLCFAVYFAGIWALAEQGVTGSC